MLIDHRNCAVLGTRFDATIKQIDAYLKEETRQFCRGGVSRGEAYMTDPVALLDKDLAAKTIEPLVTLIFDQLASDAGLETLQSLLPIDVIVTSTLQSCERTLATATMRKQDGSSTA
jgi:hypothetical protein